MYVWSSFSIFSLQNSEAIWVKPVLINWHFSVINFFVNVFISFVELETLPTPFHSAIRWFLREPRFIDLPFHWKGFSTFCCTKTTVLSSNLPWPSKYHSGKRPFMKIPLEGRCKILWPQNKFLIKINRQIKHAMSWLPSLRKHYKIVGIKLIFVPLNTNYLHSPLINIVIHHA